MEKKAKGKLKVQSESALRKKYAGSGNANEILVAQKICFGFQVDS